MLGFKRLRSRNGYADVEAGGVSAVVCIRYEACLDPSLRWRFDLGSTLGRRVGRSSWGLWDL